ncbi:hypothetical protein [Anaerosporobacter faecicola]|uniref:hypothetical protein n=1 Tax=Anaerosporobacter faecicola TaxID=2718714 RepID=UPI001439F94D|nr:hypothetical protein [Anaerosporobacter faecicola]
MNCQRSNNYNYLMNGNMNWSMPRNTNYNMDYGTDFNSDFNTNRHMRSTMKGPFSNRVLNPGFEIPIDCEWETKFWNTTGHVVRTQKNELVHTGQFAAFLSECATLSQTIFRVAPERQYEFSFYAKFGERDKDKDIDEDKDEDKEKEKENGEKAKQSAQEDNGGKEKQKNENTVQAHEVSVSNMDLVYAMSNGNDGKNKDKDKKPNHKEDLGLTATVTFLTRTREYKAAEIEIKAGSLNDTYGYYRTITPVVPCDIIAVRIGFDASEAKIRPHVPHHLGIAIDDVSFNRVN